MDVIITDGGRAEAGFKGSTGDCGVRAAAIATGIPYREVYDEINRIAKTERPKTPAARRERSSKKRSNARTGIWSSTLNTFLVRYGFTWTATMKIGSGCQVHLRAEELPSGVLVARVTKHYTAVLDGVIYDSHDPSRGGTRCVYGYWIGRP